MPLTEEFTASAQGAVAAAATLTLVAPVAPVAYKITHIAGQLEGNSSATPGFDTNLVLVDGNPIVGQLFSWRCAHPGGVGAEIFDFDVAIQISPGGSVTLQFAAGGSQLIQNLLLRGTAV